MAVQHSEKRLLSVFRMEQLDESFVGSTWTETEAKHEDASEGGIAAQQQSAIDGTQADQKPQPIRNREERVGRNDPCPCGSGKKYKKCCLKRGPDPLSYLKGKLNRYHDRLMDELIEAFEADAFHVGMDEDHYRSLPQYVEAICRLRR